MYIAILHSTLVDIIPLKNVQSIVSSYDDSVKGYGRLATILGFDVSDVRFVFFLNLIFYSIVVCFLGSSALMMGVPLSRRLLIVLESSRCLMQTSESQTA